MLASRQELERNHKQAVFSSLRELQFIESALVDLICLCHDIIAERTSDVLHYTYSRSKQIEGKGLGSLVNQFSKLSKNAVLIADLRALIKPRNDIAHNHVYQHFLDQISDITDQEILDKTIQISDVGIKATKCLTKILREIRLLEQHFAGNKS